MCLWWFGWDWWCNLYAPVVLSISNFLCPDGQSSNFPFGPYACKFQYYMHVYVAGATCRAGDARLSGTPSLITPSVFVKVRDIFRFYWCLLLSWFQKSNWSTIKNWQITRCNINFELFSRDFIMYFSKAWNSPMKIPIKVGIDCKYVWFWMIDNHVF